jgi:hypothetical protein
VDIRSILQFNQAHIESLTFQPAEKDPTASLVLSANLTPELAATMRCQEAVFDSQGKPHPHVTRLDLGEAKLRDIDLSLPSTAHEGAFDVYRPELIYGFRVEVNGMLVRLHMRARIKGRYDELVIFLAKVNKDDFEFAIRSLQQEFDWTGSGGTGQRVDMSAGEVTGPLFERPSEIVLEIMSEHPPETAVLTDEPALPAMHVVGSGRGPKQRNRRQPDDSAELRGDIAAEHHPADDAEPVFPVN